VDECKPLPRSTMVHASPFATPLNLISLSQGLTLVHSSAQRKHSLWHTLGGFPTFQ